MAAATGAAALTLGGCGNSEVGEGPLTFANLGNEITLTNNQNAEYAWRCDHNVTLHRMAANVAWCIQKPPPNGALTELLWSVFVTRGGTHPQANGRINQYESAAFATPVEAHGGIAAREAASHDRHAKFRVKGGGHRNADSLGWAPRAPVEARSRLSQPCGQGEHS